MAPTAVERRSQILDVVRELGSVRVVDLAERLGLAAVTVRRDVAALADSGLVHRSHGSVSVPRGGAATAAAGRDRVIGMLVPSAASYFDEVIDGARSAAAASGTRLVLGIASYDAADNRAQAAQLVDSGVEGLLLTPSWQLSGPPEDKGWVRELPIPAVLVERRPAPDSELVETDSVSTDHKFGALLAIRHLLSLGHESVLLAARDDSWTAHQVRAGYQEATRILGIEARPVVDLGRPEADSAAAADRIAAAAADGTRAVLVHNDKEAIQLPPLLRTRGLHVPDDVSIVSYDDVFAALSAPSLSAVAPPRRAVGASALELLLRRLGAGAELPVHHVELLPRLKVRESTGRNPD